MSKWLGVGEGSTIGGRVTLSIDPTAAQQLARPLDVVLVSGTNGKTTTTALLAGALDPHRAVTSNPSGANMPSGLTTSLLSAQRAGTAVLEVDEAYLPWAVRQLAPQLAVLLNLTRDQLDRNHEVGRTANRWRVALASTPVSVVANADDPWVTWAASAARDVTWVAAGQPWKSDSAACPACGGVIVWSPTWSCRNCRFRRPTPQFELVDGVVGSLRHGRVPLDLALPGRCNQANATMALAAADHLGVLPRQAVAQWTATHAVGGRYESVDHGGCLVRFLLAKNPAGWLEMLDLLQQSSGPVVIGLNARGEDGRDTSWIWDVPFEQLMDRTVVCVGERASDLGVRLTYAGIPHAKAGTLTDAVERMPAGSKVDFLANYSAFRLARKELDHAH